MDINGKKAIVFGGTSGIGLSATQMLSDKGAHVIALSRNPDKLKTVLMHPCLKHSFFL